MLNTSQTLQNIKDKLTLIKNIKFDDAVSGKIILHHDAEYDFYFAIDFEHDQFEIQALLRSKEPKQCWRMIFEFESYKWDYSKAAKDFVEMIEILATCPTQILRKKGLMFYKFHIMYFKNNVWQTSNYRYFYLKKSNMIDYAPEKAIYYGRQ